ncbi:unnamed protein product [Chironomus riparius]|uniref:RIIa domain-containing protein n=1 Tax=Chironomus riparius TaxID=315576 RepID=A0A9N9WS08_9DIPT|nr:unnamed protein product [Chironomus riparius]
MNFSLYHHRKLSDIISIPKGLPELMADITKQVIKYQPQNLEEFLAEYLDALVQTREFLHIAETTVDDVLINSLQIKELMRKTNMSLEQANQCCTVIRSEFSKHLSLIQNTKSMKEFDVVKRLIYECNLSIAQARKVSKIIEISWHFFYHQNKTSLLNNNLHELRLKKEANDITIKIQSPSSVEAEEATIKIQSWFRRLKIKEKEREQFKLMQKSATIIQALSRGYIQRKKN